MADKYNLSDITPLEFYFNFVQPCIYDDTTLSVYEILSKIGYKVNEIINSQNKLGSQFQVIKTWIDETLEKYAKDQMTIWLNNGTLDKIIKEWLENLSKSTQEQIDILIKKTDEAMDEIRTELNSAVSKIDKIPNDFTNLQLYATIKLPDDLSDRYIQGVCFTEHDNNIDNILAFVPLSDNTYTDILMYKINKTTLSYDLVKRISSKENLTSLSHANCANLIDNDNGTANVILSSGEDMVFFLTWNYNENTVTKDRTMLVKNTCSFCNIIKNSDDITFFYGNSDILYYNNFKDIANINSDKTTQYTSLSLTDNGCKWFSPTFQTTYCDKSFIYNLVYHTNFLRVFSSNGKYLKCYNLSNMYALGEPEQVTVLKNGNPCVISQWRDNKKVFIKIFKCPLWSPEPNPIKDYFINDNTVYVDLNPLHVEYSDYYAKYNGGMVRDGSKDKPFSSVEDALTFILFHPQFSKIHLANGEYHFSTPFNTNITIECESDNVIFTGGCLWQGRLDILHGTFKTTSHIQLDNCALTLRAVTFEQNENDKSFISGKGTSIFIDDNCKFAQTHYNNELFWCYNSIIRLPYIANDDIILIGDKNTVFNCNRETRGISLVNNAVFPCMYRYRFTGANTKGTYPMTFKTKPERCTKVYIELILDGYRLQTSVLINGKTSWEIVDYIGTKICFISGTVNFDEVGIGRTIEIDCINGERQEISKPFELKTVSFTM